MVKALQIVLLGVAFAAQVEGHGYVSEPPSRVVECSKSGWKGKGRNKNCWTHCAACLQGPSRYPEGGQKDGQLASYGDDVNYGAKYVALDEQTETRWWKNKMKPGRNKFVWTFPAPHGTFDFRYFITRPDWDPNSPLTRAQFEPTEFCRYELKPLGSRAPFPAPDKVTTHWCDVPHRVGYHVVMALWAVGDSGNTFPNVIDIDFGNGNGGPAPKPQPTKPKCDEAGGFKLCKGKENCCPAGEQCFAYNNEVSACQPSCPFGWACSPGCMDYSGFKLCKKNSNCCPAGEQCFAYSDTVSACQPSCPFGWACSSGCADHGGYKLCDGKSNCCPRGQRCYAFNDEVSACQPSCPAGWSCNN